LLNYDEGSEGPQDLEFCLDGIHEEVVDFEGIFHPTMRVPPGPYLSELFFTASPILKLICFYFDPCYLLLFRYPPARQYVLPVLRVIAFVVALVPKLFEVILIDLPWLSLEF